ncbi:hypothetical protein OJAV_G00173630 [Oryzias javanicus]|uniref:Chemokine interleukin-8-like domain-containing protein n=1 Tax=Oryzias javanicus TaxID=123683 RepID=A0A437CG91_ORYJA|nr:hypothetical protein OJAV_G00173630 [Oryzias javanicus]
MQFVLVSSTLLCVIAWMNSIQGIHGSLHNCKCIRPTNTKVAKTKIVSYTIQEESICNVRVIMFLTVKGKTICADPNSNWTKEVMRTLDEKEAMKEAQKRGAESNKTPAAYTMTRAATTSSVSTSTPSVSTVAPTETAAASTLAVSTLKPTSAASNDGAASVKRQRDFDSLTKEKTPVGHTMTPIPIQCQPWAWVTSPSPGMSVK